MLHAFDELVYNNLSYLIYQSYLCDMNYIWSVLYPCDTIMWTLDNTILITAYICIKTAYAAIYYPWRTNEVL
jgi:hypothetical protein